MKQQHILTAIFVFLAFSICQAEVDHQISAQQWKYQNMDSLVIEQRINDAAQKYQDYSIPRIVFYDNALPADSNEYMDLDKDSILMITSIVQNSEELPLKNVYVIYQDKKIQLKPILSKRMVIEDPKVKKVFGSFRQDSFYLFPMYLQITESQLAIDWAMNREGFVIAKFPDPNGLPIDFVYNDKDIAFQTGNINDDILKRFLKREYSITEQN